MGSVISCHKFQKVDKWALSAPKPLFFLYKSLQVNEINMFLFPFLKSRPQQYKLKSVHDDVCLSVSESSRTTLTIPLNKRTA